MKKFRIYTDTACDFSPNDYKRYNVNFFPYHIIFNDTENHLEHISISTAEFYKKLIASKAAKTAQITPDEFLTEFKRCAEENIDVICFTITPAFSGTSQSALLAKSMVEEAYPGMKIHIIPSTSVSSGQGLLVLEAVKMRDLGFDIDTVYTKLQQVNETAYISFTANTLEYLQRGGRIGKGAALAGALLNIKPVLVLSDNEIRPYSKVRGREKSISELVASHLKACPDYRSRNFSLIHSEAYDEAVRLSKMLKDDYDIEIDDRIFSIGSTVGVHIGPSALGICSIRKNETL